jgi:hypothetical protein
MYHASLKLTCTNENLHVTRQPDLPSTQTSCGRSSLLSALALASSSMSMPSLLSHNSQSWCVDNNGIVNYQRRWRDFVLRSITSAAAGIVIFPPLLDPVPVVTDDSKVASMVSAVAINPLARLVRIIHKVYLDVLFGSRGGKKGRLVICLFRDVMPRTVRNFLALCANRGSNNAKCPSYVGSTFYRDEVGRVFFIMRFCRVLKWMPNFPCAIFTVINHITPPKHQMNIGCSF